MTYDEALRFWYGRVNYETRAAEPHELRLGRMASLLMFLCDPQDSIPTIHIAGTKGKGSTGAMIAALAQASGKTVGLFTSPHLEHVEERFRINGTPITRDDFTFEMSLLSVMIETLESQDFGHFTFFEIATALAWNYFAARKVDLAVMEVGLGGRFDCTNVCNPAVTVITSIGYDHMAQLGNTLEEIAFQKAGILKPHTPCVVGLMADGPRDVIRRVAAEVGAPLREAGRDFNSHYHGPLRMLGDHQRRNAALAVEAVAACGASPASWQATLAECSLPARVEVTQTQPVVILDCAHNVPSVLALVETLKAEYPQAKNRFCIFAVSNDKQYEEMLPLLSSYFNHFIFTQYGNNPRCVPPEKLLALLPDGIEKRLVTPAAAAWSAAKWEAGPDDLIAITGSVFLAGELREHLIDD